MKHPALPVALLKKTVTGAVLFAVILSVTGCFGKNGTIGIYTHRNDTLKKIIKYISKDDADLTIKRKRHTSMRRLRPRQIYLL